jgi:hypothetical protein
LVAVLKQVPQTLGQDDSSEVVDGHEQCPRPIDEASYAGESDQSIDRPSAEIRNSIYRPFAPAGRAQVGNYLGVPEINPDNPVTGVFESASGCCSET